MSASVFSFSLGKAVSSRRRRTRLTESMWGVGTVIFVLLLWEALSRTGVLPAIAFPSASDVLLRLVSLLASATFWTAVGNTLSAAAIGLVIVLVIGLPLGMAIGRSRWVERSTLLTFEFLKPIPPVALLPLVLLFWGPSLTMKVFLVTMGALWPFMVQVTYGARELDSTQLDLARSYRLSRWRTIRHIFLPTLLPFGMTGMRVSASIAVIVAVVAELIGGASGMGQEIAMAQNSADLPTMYAYIFATGLLGLAINGIFNLISKPLLFWHASQRTKEH